MPTLRISHSSQEVLRRLAEESGESPQAILDEVIEMYRRQRFLEENNRAFEVLRANPRAWKAEQAERKAWDVTIAPSDQRRQRHPYSRPRKPSRKRLDIPSGPA